MPIIVEGSNAKYELAPAGNHRAVCYAIYDLGTQPGFEGKRTRKVRICWELSDELMTDGRPFSVSSPYTMSLNDKANLRKALQGWRGKPFTDEEIKRFDLATLLGKPCLVTVIHREAEGKTYANVETVSPLPKGTPAPDPVNPLVQFSISDDTMPDGTPPFIADKIKESEEWKDRKRGAPVAAGSYVPSTVGADDSIPF